MAACATCGATVLFGGKTEGKLRFCNDKCLQKGRVLVVVDQIPRDLLAKRVQEIHKGRCPRCKGVGPVDVHMSYSIWSALLVTSWKSSPHISCRPCGRRRQLTDTIRSLVLGWWGFPWGLIMTPVQITRNVGALLRGEKATAPSAKLAQQVRLEMAAQLVQAGQHTTSRS